MEHLSLNRYFVNKKSMHTRRGLDRSSNGELWDDDADTYSKLKKQYLGFRIFHVQKKGVWLRIIKTGKAG